MLTATTTFERLAEFLDRVRLDTYPEAPSGLHSTITRHMLDYARKQAVIPQGARVLDVGCGQGVALTLFREHGYAATGVSLNAEDVRICAEAGYDVRVMDQSFLEFGPEEFDLIWCRHCLEHSIFPYFTLSGFHRVLRSGGCLYVEVPAPDTASQHQTNQNHYSVLGKSMWLDLMRRAGFVLVEAVDLTFNVQAGPDQYWAFLQRKP